MARLPKSDSKTARLLTSLADMRCTQGRGSVAANFTPSDMDARTTSALLHNMARRGIVKRLGFGEWRLTRSGRRLVSRLRSTEE